MNPIFVIGAGRSGTSLLSVCLGSHPRIFMRSEYGSAGILIGDDFPVSSVAALLDERIAGFRQLCNDDRALHANLVWGNKITTEQLHGLEEHNLLNGTNLDVLERLFSAMPEYRVVFVLRDGRTCVASKMRRAGRPAVRAALRWCYSVAVYERLSRLGVVVATVRYEDLVRSPEIALRDLTDRLGIEFHESILQQTGSESIIPAYRHGRFLTEKAEEKPTLPDGILELIEPDLAKLGYL